MIPEAGSREIIAWGKEEAGTGWGAVVLFQATEEDRFELGECQ